MGVWPCYRRRACGHATYHRRACGHVQLMIRFPKPCLCQTYHHIGPMPTIASKYMQQRTRANIASKYMQQSTPRMLVVLVSPGLLPTCLNIHAYPCRAEPKKRPRIEKRSKAASRHDFFRITHLRCPPPLRVRVCACMCVCVCACLCVHLLGDAKYVS